MDNNFKIHVINERREKIIQRTTTISLIGFILFVGSILGTMPIQTALAQPEGNTLLASSTVTKKLTCN